MRRISVVGEEMAGSQRDGGMGGREGEGLVALGVGSGWHGVKGRFPGQT